MTFDPTGQKLYVGIKNEICIFDVNIPGRTCTKRKTYGSKEDGGLKGIVSSIAVSVEALLLIDYSGIILKISPLIWLST